MTAHFYSTFISAAGQTATWAAPPLGIIPGIVRGGEGGWGDAGGSQSGPAEDLNSERARTGPGLLPFLSLTFLGTSAHSATEHTHTFLRSRLQAGLRVPLIFFFQAHLLHPHTPPHQPPASPPCDFWVSLKPIGPSPSPPWDASSAPADVPSPTPSIPAIPRKPAAQPLSPGNKDKRANSKAGTAGVCCLEIRRVCLKFSKSNLLTEEGRLGWRGALFFRVGEKRWVMECRQWRSVLRSHLGHPTQLGPPHSSLSIPIPAPAQDPLVHRSLQTPPLSSLHPQPTQPPPYPCKPRLLPAVSPSPQPSSHCRHPAFGTSFQGTHSASTSHSPPPQPWCPLFPVCSTREKYGRRLSGHWEQAEEAAGASWRKGVPQPGRKSCDILPVNSLHCPRVPLTTAGRSAWENSPHLVPSEEP